MAEKNVFVLGDSINDTMLVRDSPWNLDRSSNPDLFTHDKVRIYQTPTGTHTLSQLLSEMREIIVVSNMADIAAGNMLKNKNGSIHSLEAVSEWRVGKEGNLFLVEQIGEDETTESIDLVHLSDLFSNKLKNSNIMAVYNVSDVLYCLDEQLNKINANCDIVFRTIFHAEKIKERRITKCLKQFCEHSSELAKQTILLFDVNELRQGGSNIQKGASWESLVTDTVRSLKDIQYWDQFKAIVVCFNYEGCLVYSKKSNHPVYKLFFYPDEIEGDHVSKNEKRVSGTITTMQVSLIRALALDRQKTFEDNLYDGVKRGLRAMRDLLNTGFTQDAKFPFKVIFDSLTKDEPVSKESKFPADSDVSCSVETSIVDTKLENSEYTLHDICKQIVTSGTTDQNIPFLRYGKLITYDKLEIERLRNTHHLFCSYIKNVKMTNPLSICVFGPPGSGKSFAVEEIAKVAKAIDGTRNNTEILKFNLSQMKDSVELSHVFHQIRDAGLKKKLPIVFFDEFDSKLKDQEFGWLKYFLAPMQDGEFMENVVPHFIGRAIFIFAGGTSVDMDEFKYKAKVSDPSTKAQDFLSRLKGYINVLGPNHTRCPHGKKFFKDNPEKCVRFANIIKDIGDSISFLHDVKTINKITAEIEKKCNNEEKISKMMPGLEAAISTGKLILSNVNLIKDKATDISEHLYEAHLLEKVKALGNALDSIGDEGLKKKAKAIENIISDMTEGLSDDELPEKIEKFSDELSNNMHSAHIFSLIETPIDELLKDIYSDDIQKICKIINVRRGNTERPTVISEMRKTFPELSEDIPTDPEFYEEVIRSIQGDENLLGKIEELNELNEITELCDADKFQKVIKNFLKSRDLINDLARDSLFDDATATKIEAIKNNFNTDVKKELFNAIVINDLQKTVQGIKKILDVICADEFLKIVQDIMVTIDDYTKNKSVNAFICKIKVNNEQIEVMYRKKLLEKAKAIKRTLPIVFKVINGKDPETTFSVSNDMSDSELQTAVEKIISNFETLSDDNSDEFLKRVNDIKKCSHADNYCHDDTWDANYMLRRASLLRSVLEKKLYPDKNKNDQEENEVKEIKVDDNVFNAFMHVETYLYGTRSLEAIVQTSEITQGQRFSARCININSLELYVDNTFKEILDEKRKHPKISKLWPSGTKKETTPAS